MKKLVIIVGLLVLFPVFLSAQTAAELETMLETTVVNCAQAARFVMYSENPAFEGDAFEQAVANGWLKKSAANDPVTLGKLSFLIMKAFGMKGGMMYAVFPGPRYAYRSMVSDNYIQGIADPAMQVDGNRFLLILGRVLSAKGDEI